MANLTTAMDSEFWDHPISSPQNLDGCAHSIPGDPFPLEVTRASRALRIQQLGFLANGFPLGIIPSYSPTSSKELGSFNLQSLFLKLTNSDSWLGLVGQFRPKKLISSIKAEFTNADEFEWPAFRNVAKHVLDKSLYSIGLSSQISLSSSSSLLLSTERHGEKKKPRYKMTFWHELPDHDITLEAAWPELFIDNKGKYWDVPESMSLDMTSLPSESGFRYRFGIHKNCGHPQPVNAQNGEAPHALLPRLCTKAAFSYEKSKDIWRQREKKDDTAEETDKDSVRRPTYDVRLSEPHAAISGVIGGTCAAWFVGEESSQSAESNIDADASVSTKKRSPLNADLLGSVCYTYQHGKFTKYYGDLTRVDARLDICSASAVAKRVFNIFRGSPFNNADNPQSSPKLSLILQQQIAGPIIARVDSKFSLGSSSGKEGPHVEDFICSLSYSLRLLRSGKVVAWYSPKRREGMIELRVFEF